MRGMYDFIVKPIEGRYDNIKNIGDKELITNSGIEDYKSVSNIAIVIALPLAFESDIKVGDIVVIHHNVFRRFYDMKGREKNSRSYLKDNIYLCSYDQIYLYKGSNNKWKSFGDRCFVKPILCRNYFYQNKEEPNIGIVKHDNKSLNGMGIKNGMLVTFKPNSEFEFVIDSQRLYCMKSNDIVIKHEYKGDEKEYNPSWTKSC